MDKTDHRILACLDENARLPISLLAKSLRISRQRAEYRVQRLVKNKVILHFSTLIDPTKFFANMWHVYLKLQNVEPKHEQDIMDYLSKIKGVWWIVKCQGEWDLICSFIGNDIISFDNMLDDFRSTFYMFINQYQITTFISAFIFARGYLGNNKRKRIVYAGERHSIALDMVDRKILEAIVTDARMPATTIGTKVDLTPKQVISRIKRLQTNGVIRMFRLHLDLKQIGYDYYKVCFYMQDYTNKIEQRLLSWCETNPFVIDFVKKIAPWTFEIEFETPDFKTLNTVLREMRTVFGSIIRRTEITILNEEFGGELNFLRQ